MNNQPSPHSASGQWVLKNSYNDNNHTVFQTTIVDDGPTNGTTITNSVQYNLHLYTSTQDQEITYNSFDIRMEFAPRKLGKNQIHYQSAVGYRLVRVPEGTDPKSITSSLSKIGEIYPTDKHLISYGDGIVSARLLAEGTMFPTDINNQEFQDLVLAPVKFSKGDKLYLLLFSSDTSSMVWVKYSVNMMFV